MSDTSRTHALRKGALTWRPASSSSPSSSINVLESQCASILGGVGEILEGQGNTVTKAWVKADVELKLRLWTRTRGSEHMNAHRHLRRQQKAYVRVAYKYIDCLVRFNLNLGSLSGLVRLFVPPSGAKDQLLLARFGTFNAFELLFALSIIDVSTRLELFPLQRNSLVHAHLPVDWPTSWLSSTHLFVAALNGQRSLAARPHRLCD